MIEIRRTNSNHADFVLMVAGLDMDLTERYGDIQKVYDQLNKIGHLHTAVVAYKDNVPVGCGCFKEFDPETAEIKRMFVSKNYRGQGISKMILEELENWALENGFKKVILETGILQPEAIGLYRKSGYENIENYRQYAGVETSICMIKELKVIQ
jgi:putative acetyltransferase